MTESGKYVMRYIERLDAFFQFRIIGRDELGKLLEKAKLGNRFSYASWVLSQCLERTPKEVKRRLHAEAGTPLSGHPLTETLYEICVEVNPDLDIRRVTIPMIAPERKKQKAENCGKRKKMSAKILEASLKRRIIGQAEAVRRTAQALARAWTGLRDEERPVGAFLFLGRTGVGKTETAKALAEVLTEMGDGGDGKPVRIDCSEYAMPHEYAKLIGAPPGYIGHEQGGYLQSVMSRANGRVVLFDEVEKADEKIHNLLLQIMDEGFVTDAKGVRIDFTRSIILLTSNIGVGEADALRRRAGFARGHCDNDDAGAAEETAVREALRKNFKPEFLNRLDETIFFRTLPVNDGAIILDKFLEQFQQRARKCGLTAEIPKEVRKRLLTEGFSREYGARELRRTVRRLLEDSLAEALSEGALPDKGDVRCEWRDGRVVWFATSRPPNAVVPDILATSAADASVQSA
jgi:ATP-dependent Clp protease ATP-binding subunit ClpC